MVTNRIPKICDMGGFKTGLEFVSETAKKGLRNSLGKWGECLRFYIFFRGEKKLSNFATDMVCDQPPLSYHIPTFYMNFNIKVRK
jgi:hypothetical protein